MTDRTHADALACDETIMRAQERLCREEAEGEIPGRFVLLTQLCKALSLDNTYINPDADGHYSNRAMALIGTDAAHALARISFGGPSPFGERRAAASQDSCFFKQLQRISAGVSQLAECVVGGAAVDAYLAKLTEFGKDFLGFVHWGYLLPVFLFILNCQDFLTSE